MPCIFFVDGLPDHHYVELTFGGVPAHHVKRRPAIAAFSAAFGVASAEQQQHSHEQRGNLPDFLIAP